MESNLWQPRTEAPTHFAEDARVYKQRMLRAAQRLLPARRAFVIDVFDTFLPRRIKPPELTRLHIREGFDAFLEHYRTKIKVTYSDALSAKRAREWLEHLGLDSLFHSCFGNESLFDNHVAMEGKDFLRVAHELQIDPDDLVIIADGHSERNQSTWYHLDLVRIPPMSLDFPISFSFEELII